MVPRLPLLSAAMMPKPNVKLQPDGSYKTPTAADHKRKRGRRLQQANLLYHPGRAGCDLTDTKKWPHVWKLSGAPDERRAEVEAFPHGGQFERVHVVYSSAYKSAKRCAKLVRRASMRCMESHFEVRRGDGEGHMVSPPPALSHSCTRLLGGCDTFTHGREIRLFNCSSTILPVLACMILVWIHSSFGFLPLFCAEGGRRHALLSARRFGAVQPEARCVRC